MTEDMSEKDSKNDAHIAYIHVESIGYDIFIM